jgi:hypothetical protein
LTPPLLHFTDITISLDISPLLRTSHTSSEHLFFPSLDNRYQKPVPRVDQAVFAHTMKAPTPSHSPPRITYFIHYLNPPPASLLDASLLLETHGPGRPGLGRAGPRGLRSGPASASVAGAAEGVARQRARLARLVQVRLSLSFSFAVPLSVSVSLSLSLSLSLCLCLRLSVCLSVSVCAVL